MIHFSVAAWILHKYQHVYKLYNIEQIWLECPRKEDEKIKYLNEIFIKVLTLKVHLVDEEFLDFD